MWIKVVIWLLVCLGALFVLAFTLLYFLQEKLIFFPDKLARNHTYRFPIPHQEEDFKVDSDTEINALHFVPDTPEGWVFYLHGNAGSLDGWGERAIPFFNRNFACTMIDYRGYGKSNGKIDPQNLFEDARKIYLEVRDRFPGIPVVLYGCSLGTGIAAWLAEQEGCDLLMLETPYLSLADVSSQHYPFLPNNLLLRYPIRTDKYVKGITAPVVMIHGTKDEVIYYGSSQKLLKLLKPDDKLITIEGGKHSNLNTYPAYHNELTKALNLAKEKKQRTIAGSHPGNAE